MRHAMIFLARFCPRWRSEHDRPHFASAMDGLRQPDAVRKARASSFRHGAFRQMPPPLRIFDMGLKDHFDHARERRDVPSASARYFDGDFAFINFALGI